MSCIISINRFYQNRALDYENRCKTKLFDYALKQYESSAKNGYPIRIFEVLQVFNITYVNSVISLFFDKYEYMGGAHGITIRDSQTWHLSECRLLALKEFFHCPNDYRKYIFAEIKKRAENQQELYFKDVKNLIEKTFNENNFYCTPWGIVIYYQQYDIAPYSGGIRGFLLPYNQCILNPQSL